jgi:hypothetical protein
VLDDPAEGIRNAAIAALGEMKDPAVVPILTRQVASDDFGRRVAAVTALCRTGLPDALGPVLSSLRRDPSPAVRSVAAREVSRFKTAALPGLTGIVTDLKEKPEIRAGAVDALVRVGGDRVVAVLTALLSDSAPEVADAAAYALASRQEKGAVPRLLEALSAGRDTLQTVAALEQVSCRSFPSARAAELPAIYKGWWGDHRDESAASWFVAALEEKGYDVGDLESLGSADPSPKTVPVLMNVLLDDAWYLRADANLWLDRVTTESFGEVTRFTSPEDVRAVREKWRAWWKAR